MRVGVDGGRRVPTVLRQVRKVLRQGTRTRGYGGDGTVVGTAVVGTAATLQRYGLCGGQVQRASWLREGGTGWMYGEDVLMDVLMDVPSSAV